MSNGISFIPSSGKKRSRSGGRGVEYTEGAKLNQRLDQPNPVPQEQAPRPKRQSGFSAWLKRRRLHHEKAEAVRQAATEPVVPTMTEGQLVSSSQSMNLVSGEIYEDEEADRQRKIAELQRFQRSPGQRAVTPPVPVILPQPDPAPAAIHEGILVAPDHAPDLLEAQPFPTQYPNDLPGQEQRIAPLPARSEQPPAAPPAPVVQPLPVEPKPPKPERKRRAKKEKKPRQVAPVAAFPVPTSGPMHLVPNEPHRGHTVDVNLIPDAVLEGLKSRNRIQDLFVVAAGTAIAVFAGFGAMKWYQNQLNVDIRQAEQQIAQVEARIISYSELQAEASVLQGELVGLEEVLNDHIYWTPFLDFLEVHTLPTVYYRSMAGSATTGSFTFTVVALDYSQIDLQASVLRDSEFVKSVTVSSATQFVASVGDNATATTATGLTDDSGQTLVSFSMTVQFSPTLFRHGRGIQEPASEISL